MQKTSTFLYPILFSFDIYGLWVGTKSYLFLENTNFTDDKPYKKIFFATLVTNPHARTHFEEEIIRAALDKGFSVKRS